MENRVFRRVEAKFVCIYMRLIQIKPSAREAPPKTFEIVKLSNNQNIRVQRPLSPAVHITV
jgi:hypothetical protein